MQNVLGEFTCRLDSKGRFRVPGELLEQLGYKSKGGHEFVISRGGAKFLSLRTIDAWEEESKVFKQLDPLKTKERRLMQLFFRGATTLTMDNADRLLIPKGLMDHAGITTEKDNADIMISAYPGIIEIWSKKVYLADVENTASDELGVLADELISEIPRASAKSDDELS